MTKAEIRAQIASRRPDFQTLENLSAHIIKKFQCLEKQPGGGSASFQTLELFQQAKAVGVYMPLPDEVDISSLFSFGSLGELALPAQVNSPDGANSPSEPPKQFYIPAFDETTGGYRMAKYTPALKQGKFGISEPEHPDWAGPEDLDLILVPGVAFDTSGNRIGRGGGFYDRLLPQYQAVRVGICFDFQCLEKIPSKSHDCTMDWLITESKFLKFAMNS